MINLCWTRRSFSSSIFQVFIPCCFRDFLDIVNKKMKKNEKKIVIFVFFLIITMCYFVILCFLLNWFF